MVHRCIYACDLMSAEEVSTEIAQGMAVIYVESLKRTGVVCRMKKGFDCFDQCTCVLVHCACIPCLVV